MVPGIFIESCERARSDAIPFHKYGTVDVVMNTVTLRLESRWILWIKDWKVMNLEYPVEAGVDAIVVARDVVL